MFYQYDESITDYLSSKDEKMAYIISKIGKIHRECDNDLFHAVLHHIIAQQISTAAQNTIWNRFQKALGVITPENIFKASDDLLQSCGITYKKVAYMKDFARKIVEGEFDLNQVNKMKDEEAIEYLSSLKGIGKWTAEMILLFCLQRKDIFSYDDLAIQRGLRMIYHHRKITKPLFEKYRKKFSPYCSIASLYIWHVSSNQCKDLLVDKKGFIVYEWHLYRIF